MLGRIDQKPYAINIGTVPRAWDAASHHPGALKWPFTKVRSTKVLGSASGPT
jgi:hypothetical protein